MAQELNLNETDAREHSLLGLAIFLLAGVLAMVIVFGAYVVKGELGIILILAASPYLVGGIGYMAMLFTRP